MAVYAIGDVQGCHDELVRLIEAIAFDPARDQLWFCGDLVNRGGQSLEVLRLVRGLGDRAVVVLGNHDLSLLSVAERRTEDQARVNPDLRRVLFAPDRDELLGWLRSRRLAHHDPALDFLMVHAGVAPRWNVEDCLRHAGEVEEKLQGEGYRRLLKQLFGNTPDLWHPKLRGVERWRATINVLTRMRYVSPRGRLDFSEKGPPGTQKPGLYTWFAVPGRKPIGTRVVCGHWSALGLFIGLGIHAIDTGCVWGGRLTALRLDGDVPVPVQVTANPERVRNGGDD
ncbi:MAG: symmetrical bis(5'-nucleosyl)-tetraphosphatase [Pseudoxanthomonas sp.]|nr:symmetrical bis(5'-nucleosyl)-tetraphosphatase [Pseudoxanthomonas sp.]